MFRISNGLIEASVSPHGAELQALCVRGQDNLIWRKDDRIWNRFCPILFPIVGRLLKDEYTYQGKAYAMRQHGFARDQSFQLVDQSPNSLTLSLTDSEITREQYPFAFELRVTYTLTNHSLEIKHDVFNPGSEDLLFSLGGHPGFHLEGSLNEYCLDFGGDFKVKQHLITGNYYNGATQDLNLNRRFKISDELFASDAIVIKSPPFQSIGFSKNDGTPLLTLRCEDWSAVGLWTKPGAPFFCIEPWWGWADSLDSDGTLEQKEGIVRLAPLQQRAFSYSLELH
jgi:galactose mutarotase-like enzyme